MPYPPWLRTGPDPDPVARARRSRRGRMFAAALSGVVQLPGLAIVLGMSWHHVGHAVNTAALLAVLSGFVAAGLLMLPWRGPTAVAVTAFAVPAIALAPGPPLATLAVAFAVARAVIGGAAAWAWGSLAGLGLVGVVWITVDGSGAGIRVLAVTVLLCVVAAAATGAAARRARFRAAAREEATRRRSAAEEERLRIARELHDVLAHSLSQISVQAGVGLHLFDDDPERARESLRSIRDTSATALDEVRGVLGMLRDSTDTAAPRRPEPSLQAVPGLIADARAVGTRVTVSGDIADGSWDASVPVPAAVQSAAFRIVQEALTNVRRHAPAADVDVHVAATPGAVEIRVRNGPDVAESLLNRNGAGSVDEEAAGAVPPDRAPEGRAPGDRAPEGRGRGGRGILGMRERARALGGSLSAEPTPDGGFVVMARLPVQTGGNQT